jgi:SecD/SecF fusion protein
MDGQGAKAWEELTGRAYTKKNIAIVLITLYILHQGFYWAYSGGRSEISGSLT